MKTIADFKRAIKLGAKVHTTYHQEFAGRNENGSGEPVFKDKDMGTREVSKVQSNSFAFKTKKADGSFTDSWCNWPKSNECVINGNTVVIMQEDYRQREVNPKPMIPILTYTIIES